MGEEQRQALARLLAEDAGFKAALGAAASVEEAVKVAREYGLDATAEDFVTNSGSEISDVELQMTAGGKYPSMDCEYTTPFDMRHPCGRA